MSKRRAARPNIVLITADDLGYSDLGCYGSEISTSNLDRLASDGVRLTQMYSCPSCSPSQASLLTGLHPHQAGVGHTNLHLGHPSYQGFLSDRCVTIAEVLRETGYRTLMSGSWRVGGLYDVRLPETWNPGDTFHPTPLTRGFEHFYGTLGAGGGYFHPCTLMEDERFVELEELEEQERTGFYLTDAVTNSAVDFITEYAPYDEPFFLFVSYTAPRRPLEVPEEDIARYRGRYMIGWDRLRKNRHQAQGDSGLLDGRWRLSPRDPRAPAWRDVRDKDLEDRRMAVYAAQIGRMDRGIGSILAALETKGDYENTLVIFLSDNGACAEPTAHTAQKGGPDTPGSYGLPWANASNTPFRLFKRRAHEGGISVPLIASWPKQTRGGGGSAVPGAPRTGERAAGPAAPARLFHGPVHITDVASTILDAAGAPHPREHRGRKVQPPEGVSFLPVLRDEPWDRGEPLFWEHEGSCAVRSGEWKLVKESGGEWELYSMSEDRTELRDLSAGHPGKAAELEELWNAWARRCRVLSWQRLSGRGERRTD